MLSYIEATLVKGYTKKAAYLEFIDPDNKNPHKAIALMEKKKEYKDIYDVIVSDDNVQTAVKIGVVKKKFVNLVEQNMDLMSDVLKDAKKADGMREKATAVRLANETIQAMSVVSGGNSAANGPPQGNLDRSAVIS